MSQQQSLPPMQQNPEQRLIEIQAQYEVDPETAMGIMAAEDHGIAPEQYLQFMGVKQ
jgi:prolyl-tRNA editing enzyme YbaK/EbsC (Cys-tRNA(Pro) deacylase)